MNVLIWKALAKLAAARSKAAEEEFDHQSSL